VGRDTVWGQRALELYAFQSTRPRGARQKGRGESVDKRLRFNPRAHVGRDELDGAGLLVSMVSIHAPTWGATFSTSWLRSPTEFQSTRPRGARPEADVRAVFTELFQSTRPCGARRPRPPRSRSTTSFNPRARVGRDRLLDNWLIIKDKVNAFCEHYKK
jgi:hypothetical protein